MRDGGRDFRTGEPIEAHTSSMTRSNIHHIFPERWCKNPESPLTGEKLTAIKATTYNSIINKTAISARTNRQIGGRPPSKYLPAIENAAEIDRGHMGEILASHCIAPDRLRTDDFWGFFAARAEMLLRRIETATGKKITREPELFGDDHVVSRKLRRRAGAVGSRTGRGHRVLTRAAWTGAGR